nr:Abi family protein [Bacteroidota bacterium]
KDTSHTFFPGITFDRVLKTYLFDRKLRLLVFDAIERIEIALNQMGFPEKWNQEQLWTNIKE